MKNLLYNINIRKAIYKKSKNVRKWPKKLEKGSEIIKLHRNQYIR